MNEVETRTAPPRFSPGVRLQYDRRRGRWVVQSPERLLVPDQTATAILSLVDGRRSIDEIVDELAVRFAAPRPRIAADAETMLRELAGKGIVTL